MTTIAVAKQNPAPGKRRIIDDDDDDDDDDDNVVAKQNPAPGKRRIIDDDADDDDDDDGKRGTCGLKIRAELAYMEAIGDDDPGGGGSASGSGPNDKAVAELDPTRLGKEWLGYGQEDEDEDWQDEDEDEDEEEEEEEEEEELHVYGWSDDEVTAVVKEELYQRLFDSSGIERRGLRGFGRGRFDCDGGCGYGLTYFDCEQQHEEKECRSNTYAYVDELEGTEGDFDEVSKLNIRFCKGCESNIAPSKPTKSAAHVS
jgi:hypothetical protein